MNINVKKKLITYLKDFVTGQRWETLQEVLDRRTRYITVVLEDIYQSHNASAVLRSCDCFGIQDVHIIENHHQFDTSKGVTIGADQWLSMHFYRESRGNNTQKCFEKLKNEGFKIVATTPHEKNHTIRDLKLDQKTALVFGAELTGISDYVKEEADEFVSVPMFGFSESYNISVSAALCLYELSLRLRQSDIDWKLAGPERVDLQLEWLEQSIRASERLKKKFLKEQNL